MELKLNNRKYKILTPSGYQPFTGIRKLEKGRYYDISLSNGKSLKCSDNHPFISNGVEVSSSELVVGSKIDSVDGGYVEVISINIIENSIELYDIVDVFNGNLFNVDGIVSHNCDFLSSGDTVIPGEVLAWYKDNHIKEPLEKRGMLQNYWIWEYPDYSRDYIVTADVARGDGADYSAFHVLDVESMKQVASFKGKIDTKEYGKFLSQVGHEWNEALVVVENANIGWAVLQEMIDIGYPNIFYSSKDMQVVDVQYSYITRSQNSDNPTTPGFTTSSKTRPMLISKLDEYVRKKEVIIQDTRLIEELFTFIWQGQKAQAMRGYNDDMVMSYAIALWVRDTALRLRTERMDLTKLALNGIRKTSDAVYTSGYFDNPYVQEIKGERVDLTWLFDKK